MFPNPEVLSPIQHMVLMLVGSGSSVSAAAETAGVHRNTIYNWRRTSAVFRTAWFEMLQEQATYWREQLCALAQTAIETIRTIMVNANHSAAVRLRAAQSILKISMNPTPMPKVHNPAQSDTPKQPAAAPEPDPKPDLTPAFTCRHLEDMK